MILAVLCIIALSVFTFTDAQSCPGSKITDVQRKTLIRQHNLARAKLARGQVNDSSGRQMPRASNMMELTWSCELEKSAQEWVSHCSMDHSPLRRQNKVGENIYSKYAQLGIQGKVNHNCHLFCIIR
ncbi:unnamed protein product [Gongylonema pulchrum]|uniref:SCP domain-containing protein n=1 Tax=Gongylonema pulchrum TaxID=637853 RepID=A0A183EGM6_9BILA|nr:unnamed protein product [Gongylonema pulchrum]